MRVPRATYRLQVHGGTTLDDVADLVDYLHDLGISDVYLSPIMTAPPGAAHGYHIVDPTRVDRQIGGDAALRRLHGELDRRGMGLLLDIVPNHLAASEHNPFWRSLLAEGPDAPYAHWFDVDWDAGDGRVVLPILGEDVDTAIASGSLRIDTSGSKPELAYHDRRLPLAPPTRETAAELVRDGAGGAEMRDLLDGQHYRLAYWRTGVQELNYRRFFDITDLVGTRVEDPDVFTERHRRLLELVAEGVITGLRVDHIDGLRDPHDYLRTLADAAADAADQADFYVVVEKIVEGDEAIPADWPIAGTTGYELLNAVNATFVDRDGLGRLDAVYRRRTGIGESVADILHRRKLDALHELFAGEVNGLADAVDRLARTTGAEPPPGREAVHATLTAVTACFPVYRTYIADDSGKAVVVSTRDRGYLEAAFEETRRRHPELDADALAFLESVLSLDLPPELSEETRRQWLEAVLRWQQLTGPAMAKGFEDTTLYVFNRFVALNEVGVDAHGVEEPHGPGGFHARTTRRAGHWPLALNATSTHDTKRSEDVRARLDVLSETPEIFLDAVRDWTARHAHLVRTDAAPSPDENERWLLYQTLVGMWPLEAAAESGVRDRLHAYVEKAAREAKVHTSWLDPDATHEAALHRYVDGILDDEDFVADLRDVVERIAVHGAVNSLAQVVVKVAAPGVPDFYQGTELWNHSLVDPDNRRPVDWRRRRDALDRIRARASTDRPALARELRTTWRDGRVKLFVTWAALECRNRHQQAFLSGGYEALAATGPLAAHVLAFVRRSGDTTVVAAVPRLVASVVDGWPLGDLWDGTRIPVGSAASFRDAFTGATLRPDRDGIALAEAWAELPVTLLVAEDR